MIKIKEGIAFSDDKPIILHVIDLEIFGDYGLKATFSDGVTKFYDCSQLFKYPTFAILKDRNKFKSVSLDRGVPTWKNENLDLSPETIYANGSIAA